MALQVVEDVYNKTVGVLQGEVGLAIINANENAANNQLFGVRLVHVRGSVRGITFPGSDVVPLLGDEEVQQLGTGAVVPDENRVLSVVGQSFEEFFGAPNAQLADQIRRQHGAQRFLDGRVGRRSVLVLQVAAESAASEQSSSCKAV